VVVVQDGVLADDRRVVAAELQGDPGEAAGGHLHDPLAAVDAAGEADLGDVGVVDQAGHLAVPAGDHVEHARGQLLGDPLHQPGGGQRRGRRGLHDRGVAGQQGVREGGGEDRERPVERHDHGDHADRLVGHGGLHRDARGRRQHLGRLDLTGEGQRQLPADLEDQGVDPGLVHDLAVLQGEDAGVLVALVGEALDGGGHLGGALGGRQRRPRRVGGLRRGDGVGHVGLGRRGRGADDDAGPGGVDDLEDVGGAPCLAADVEPRRHRGGRVRGARHADHLSVGVLTGAGRSTEMSPTALFTCER
jgi:hypothetical protein